MSGDHTLSFIVYYTLCTQHAHTMEQDRVCAVAEAASVACAIDTAAVVLERILHEAVDAQVYEASHTCQ
jgi:hypothetical protein